MRVGLIEIALRTGATIRLCDGGFLVFGGHTFASEDTTFGSIIGVDTLNEGTGDQVPALRLTLAPASGVSIPTLANPANARSPVRMWLVDVDQATGLPTETPAPKFIGVIEKLSVRLGENSRLLTIDTAAVNVRLLDRYEGNHCSSAFHKRVWPGETGEDHRTGLQGVVAWGAPSPPRGSTFGGGGGGGGGGPADRQVNYL